MFFLCFLHSFSFTPVFLFLLFVHCDNKRIEDATLLYKYILYIYPMGKELKMALVKLHSFSIAAKHIKELKIGSSRLKGEKLYKPLPSKFPIGEKAMSKEKLLNQIIQLLQDLNEKELQKVIKYIKELSKNQSKKKYKLSKETVRRIIEERVCPVCSERYVDISYDTERKQYFFIHYTPSTRYCYVQNEFIDEIIELSKEQRLTIWYTMLIPSTIAYILGEYNWQKRDTAFKVNLVVKRFLNKYRDIRQLGERVQRNINVSKKVTELKYGKCYMEYFSFDIEFPLYLDLLRITEELKTKGIWVNDQHIVLSSIVEFIDVFYTEKSSHIISLIKSF